MIVQARAHYGCLQDDEALAIMPGDIQGQSDATLHLAAQLVRTESSAGCGS